MHEEGERETQPADRRSIEDPGKAARPDAKIPGSVASDDGGTVARFVRGFDVCTRRVGARDATSDIMQRRVM